MSRISKVVLALAVVAIAAAGCKKKASDSGSGAATTGGGGDEAAPAPDVFARMDLAGRAKALQGAWVLDSAGMLAIGIQGDDVTTYDGKKEVHAKLKITSPCQASFAVQTKMGEEATSYSLVMKDGKAALGLGTAGEKQGKGAVVCAGLGVYVLDDAGTCTEWKHFGQWSSEPGTCGFRQEDGKTVFFAKTMGGEDTAPVDGDVIWADQLRDERAKPVADYATARAAVDAHVKANDPGQQAQAAGGKVGDTSTVAGLIATFGADKTKVEGQKVTVTGRFMSSNKITSGDKTTYNAMLAIDKDHLQPTLMCNTAAEVTGLMQWDEVTAEGTVHAFGDEPVLDDCTVTKQK
jgi:hypothetical protein